MNTGVTSYVTQTGTNIYGQPIYSVTGYYPYSSTTLYCSGTIVTNSDGTRSCVTQVGINAYGYPIFKVKKSQ